MGSGNCLKANELYSENSKMCYGCATECATDSINSKKHEPFVFLVDSPRLQIKGSYVFRNFLFLLGLRRFARLYLPLRFSNGCCCGCYSVAFWLLQGREKQPVRGNRMTRKSSGNRRDDRGMQQYGSGQGPSIKFHVQPGLVARRR